VQHPARYLRRQPQLSPVSMLARGYFHSVTPP